MISKEKLPPISNIKHLNRMLEQKCADIIVLQSQLNSANAIIEYILDDTGKLSNLNALKQNAKVIFRKAPSGIVISVNNQITGPEDDVMSAKATVKHEDGSTSYHAYRFDGMSHYCPSFDIQKITSA